ncbi:MAG TPA: hypothetical protein VJH03_19125 [Blastocatellia bacterium]|nr:hypothetical protein [Blastocatellia bacterium]
MSSKKSIVVSRSKTKRSGEDNSRRDFLGKAGLAAGMVLVYGPPTSAAGGGAPGTTQVDQLLKLNRGQAAKLTAAARELTKADLQALGRGDLAASRRAANLTIADLKSLTDVMTEIAGPSARLRKEGAGITINCCEASTARGVFCCCCCCCCCAVAMEPARAVV